MTARMSHTAQAGRGPGAARAGAGCAPSSAVGSVVSGSIGALYRSPDRGSGRWRARLGAAIGSEGVVGDVMRQAGTVVQRPPAGTIPDAPGSYQFKDAQGRVIYVGKAKSLRQRLSNYFQNPASMAQ